MNNDGNIIPEAGNLYSALRNSGYSNIAAIGDLIDNSLDAGATIIKIEIADDLRQVFLSDNGTGMSPETLNQALKLGGRKAHDNANDLGKYGLGLITASISMGTKLRVITRKDKITSTGLFDVEEVYESNKFVALFRDANEAEIRNFDYRTGNAESGTVLIIENCDKIQYSNLKPFIKELKDYIKSTFWAFISDGSSIFVNDEPVPSEDPLFRFDKRTEIVLGKTIDVSTDDGKTERLEILAVLLPDFDNSLKRSMKINIETQGFYILRNNREIAAAVEIIDVFKKHNDFNRLRIKLNFGPGLDDEMGVNYTKHNVSPNKRMVNILKAELSDKLKELRKRLKGEQGPRKGNGPNNPFTEPGAIIPPTPINPPTTTPPKNFQPNAPKTTNLKMKFGNEKDSLLSVSSSEKNVAIVVNGMNKFYKQNVTKKENGPEFKKYFDCIIKALLDASVKNNLPTDTIEKIIKDVSSTLEESEL